MELLDLSLATPEENLALDEALLMEAEEGDLRETLRFWESPKDLVVIGRASKIAEEANLTNCEADGVPVLRRTSGGCAIVGGPGCLMYSLIIDLRSRPHLRDIQQAHREVLERICRGIHRMAPELAEGEQPLRREGISDLVCGETKVSGNSLQVKRYHLLYHGTFLYSYPLEKISRYLKTPPREPEYRAGRTHASFVENLEVPAQMLKTAMRNAWNAEAIRTDWPEANVKDLVETKYQQAEWNARR
ncbi:Lipoate-protein ligase LplJ [Planctomycetales bacterium 10988]|nr:Lipoate-protein ligase LplJ [Planctomycetales bacterium 10988]